MQYGKTFKNIPREVTPNTRLKKKKIKINERRQKELSKTMTAEQEVFNQV